MQYIWHPCSQMKDYEKFPPLDIARANGSFLYLKNGKRIIDAISSWWCKSLGHNHSGIKAALFEQLEQFEHVLLANTTHDAIETLARKLAQLSPNLTKSFYAGDGSCAVEIAMKMSLHARLIEGKPAKKKFIALQNAYHGETAGAMSVSDLGLYRAPYKEMLFDVYFLTDLPYVNGRNHPLWSDCAIWPAFEKKLIPLVDETTAIIIEPILQGAAGMQIYSADFVKRLREFCTLNDVHLIADEIMTGIGRTGKMLACDHANVAPDFLCLAKGLTAGWLPFSVVLTSQEIYSLFYDDYSTGKSFLHSHTHSGNAMGARIALEVLSIMEREKICDKAFALEGKMLSSMHQVAKDTGHLRNVRGIGGVVAADLINPKNIDRLGYQVYQKAVELGALLRPIGNTIYWLPPLNIHQESLNDLKNITQQAILSVLG